MWVTCPKSLTLFTSWSVMKSNWHWSESAWSWSVKTSELPISVFEFKSIASKSAQSTTTHTWNLSIYFGSSEIPRKAWYVVNLGIGVHSWYSNDRASSVSTTVTRTTVSFFQLVRCLRIRAGWIREGIRSEVKSCKTRKKKGLGLVLVRQTTKFDLLRCRESRVFW